MDGQSKNLTQEYIKQLQTIFPEAVTEVADKDGNNTSLKVDMEKLSILLGEASIPEDDTDYKQKYGEKFSFEWAGKRRAIAEAQKRSTGTLRPCPEESEDWENTENLYIEGDNLEVLKLLQDSYLGAIKMIYIDPPYNTGKDFVYKDNYRDNLSNYLEQTNTTNAVNSEASGRYHTNWLNMMYPRLKLARNLLTDDGVIFISIDDNEISNLKTICDEIFGEDNCIALITVIVKPEGRGYGFFAKTHEQIIVYAKDINIVTLNEIEVEGAEYKYYDNKGGFNLKGLRNRNVQAFNSSNRPNLRYPFYVDIDNPNSDGLFSVTPLKTENYLEIYPSIIDGKESVWRWGKDKSCKEKDELTAYKGPDGEIRIFQKERKLTQTPKTVWFNKNILSNKGSSEVQNILGKGIFNFPKPLHLIKSILNIGITSESHIILDFFSGSATTAHAVMELNAEDDGCRKYICVQLPEKNPDNSEAQKAGYKTITEIAKERIRRAGKKILEEQKNKKQGDLFTEPAKKLDIGFKVFKLDRSNVADWDLELNTTNERDAKETLTLEFNKVLNILKEGRTELDLLYEVMLKLGLQLTTKVEEKEINGKKVYVVGHGVMVASFAKDLTYSDITKMLEYKPDYVQPGEFKVVLSDESFASNNDKVNAMQLFKQKGITNFEII